jgi:hypothetical protein
MSIGWQQAEKTEASEWDPQWLGYSHDQDDTLAGR